MRLTYCQSMSFSTMLRDGVLSGLVDLFTVLIYSWSKVGSHSNII